MFPTTTTTVPTSVGGEQQSGESSMTAGVCLSEAQMLIGGTVFEVLVAQLFFPPLFLVGIIGNAINLCVLLSPSMRSRANNLLAAMAMADMTFLLFMLPHSLANYPFVSLNYTFRLVYFHVKKELTALANWSSAAAIWYLLAVCIDRLIGIRSPLYSHRGWSHRRTLLLILGIGVATGLLTSYHHFAYDCFRYWFCNGTQLISACLSVASEKWKRNETNPHPQWLRDYVHVGTVANALFVIFVPMYALIALNTMLMIELHKRGEEPLLTADYGNAGRRNSDRMAQRRQERKVAVTVVAIVFSFVVTQGPSAVILLWNLVLGYPLARDSVIYDLGTAANFLVVCGKAGNFFLFCLSSTSFRQRLTLLFRRHQKRAPVRRTSSPRNSATSTMTTLLPVCKRKKLRSSSAALPEHTAESISASQVLRKYRSLDQKDSDLSEC